MNVPSPDAPRRLSGDLRRAGAATGRAARAGARALRRLTHARGAGESGLARVLELHLVSTAADTLIVTALATTIFFAVPTHQARGRVATSLLITMIPFILLAPVIGPLLDRVRHGRRYALATTMVFRAFLAWVMAGAVGVDGRHTGIGLYPAALGFLVCQKAYLVSRAAAVPRVLPRGVGLVPANARVSLAGVVAMAVFAPLGAGINAWVGPQWTLRLAFVVFAGGTVLALRLPPKVDSSEGEVAARISSHPESRRAETQETDHHGPAPRAPERAATPHRTTRPWSIGPRVVLGLRVNAGLRAFAGFLTLFLAFRLRTDPLPGLDRSAAVAALLVAAAIGGAVGTLAGGALRRIPPDAVVLTMPALCAIAAAWAAWDYGLWTVLTVSAVAGLAQALGKLCLDALIQRHVPEAVRTSAFARSETVLQLAWVVGGAVGLVLPLSGPWGLGIAALATGLIGIWAGIAAVQRSARMAPAEG